MGKKLIFWLSVLPVIFSCMREDLNVKKSAPLAEQEVEISIYRTDTGNTRGLIPEENRVANLDLLVFKADQFLYWRSAYKVDNKFRATLMVDNGLDVHFLANARQQISELEDQGELTAGISWEAMRSKLIDDGPARLSYINSSQISLPMWGMVANKDVNDVPLNHWGQVNLLRSVASVDVEVSTDIDDDIFLLEDIRLYFVPDRGFLATEPVNYDAAEMAVLAADSPSDMKTALTLFSDAYEPSSKSIANKLYLYDNDTDERTRTSLPDVSRRHTRVVVGATYRGTKCYYPIDFETENDALDQVTRNWKYTFRINSVTSRGYVDPDEASREPATGLNVSIVKWTEKLEGDFYVSGPYYMGITWDPYWAREVVLERPAGSTRLIGLRSNIKADLISLEFSPGSTNGPTVEVAGGISNSRFLVNKTVDSNGYILGLLFTALADYDAADPASNHDRLIVTAGRIEFEIPITQIAGGSNDWGDGGDKDTDLQ